MDKLIHVYDSTGNVLFFEQFILDCQSNFIKLSQDQHLQAVKTISAPTLIFELNHISPIRYYYRAIGLDNPLLIGVNFCNGMWKVKQYLENISAALLLSMIKENLFDGRIDIYIEDDIGDSALQNLFI